MRYREIEDHKELVHLLEGEQEISSVAFQSLDFSLVAELASDKVFKDCIFLGCRIPESLHRQISECSLVFPEITVPFNPYVNTLYTHQTLFRGYRLGDPSSYSLTPDKIIYDHFIAHGKEATDIRETLARRLHDHAITDALHDFALRYDERRIVAVMGGHGLLRTDPGYREVALISKVLTERGYLMVSGGGPGAMEATHLGAWLAGKEEHALSDALEILSCAPRYDDEWWLDKAFAVINRFPAPRFESVGIPTWLYGHELPTPLATRIAKYFANSVREDGLLALAKGGVVFSPGSAGTIQEIFQDATQNHYLSFGYASPMVFLNRDYWTRERPVYPLLEQLSREGKYKNLILSLCDNYGEALEAIMAFTT